MLQKNKQNWVLAVGFAVCCSLALQASAAEVVDDSTKAMSHFSNDCDSYNNLIKVAPQKAYCMDRKEFPAVISGEKFIFPESVVGGFYLSKSETWRYGDSECGHSISVCNIALNTISGKGGIVVSDKQNPMPYDRLKSSPFADKLEQEPTKMESQKYGEFYVKKIITGHKYRMPITDKIDGAIVLVFMQPKDSNALIVACGDDLLASKTVSNMCRMWYDINDFTYFWYIGYSLEYSETKIFEQFMDTKNSILSYQLPSSIK